MDTQQSPRTRWLRASISIYYGIYCYISKNNSDLLIHMINSHVEAGAPRIVPKGVRFD
jgi:hypothetical protein